MNDPLQAFSDRHINAALWRLNGEAATRAAASLRAVGREAPRPDRGREDGALLARAGPTTGGQRSVGDLRRGREALPLRLDAAADGKDRPCQPRINRPAMNA